MKNKNWRIFRGVLGWATVLFLVLRPVVVCASNTVIQSHVAAALSDDSGSAKKAPSLFNHSPKLKKIAKQLPRPKNVLSPVVVAFHSTVPQTSTTSLLSLFSLHRPPWVALRI